jgi:hypothetical protein
MNFSQAITALKEGLMLQRVSWGSPEYFVFMQVPAHINKEIVPKMQSLPQSVKDEFAKRFNNPEFQINSIYYDDQLVMVNPYNKITGWSPQAADCLANDWQILS